MRLAFDAKHVLRTTTKACVYFLVAVAGLLIVLTSLNYFPPSFESGFLQGREGYFYSWYAAAFYTHVISAPIGLLLGLLQASRRLRIRKPRVHRRLGSTYVWNVLLFIVPSGLLMSTKAGGPVTAGGFASLAIATGVTTYLGYSSAKHRNLVGHRRWMTRSYILMCSAISLRFLAELCLAMDWKFITYDALAWMSWLPLLICYELVRIYANRDSFP